MTYTPGPFRSNCMRSSASPVKAVTFKPARCDHFATSFPQIFTTRAGQDTITRFNASSSISSLIAVRQITVLPAPVGAIKIVASVEYIRVAAACCFWDRASSFSIFLLVPFPRLRHTAPLVDHDIPPHHQHDSVRYDHPQNRDHYRSGYYYA